MQRIVTNLQAVVKSRGLSLPAQLQPAAADMAGADASQGDNSGGSGSQDEGGGGSRGESDTGGIGSGGSPGSLPLSVLLGGSLVDRMDLLGRTGGGAETAGNVCSVVRHLQACEAAAIQ